MQALFLFGLAGFLAQFVNGTLGMGYGMTSTTALLASGTVPAIASASAHVALIGTSFASGVSHWTFRNIDWRTVGILAIPGGVGACLGALFLISLSGGFATAWVGVVLFMLGVYVLVRFTFFDINTLVRRTRPRPQFLVPLGFAAGFIDASGGGGWGPVATTALLSSGRLEPRKVVGSVSTAEFLVTTVASAAFLSGLSLHSMNGGVIVGLLVGGILAAPCGAWLVRRIPARMLGVTAGGLIVLTNGWLLLGLVGAPDTVSVLLYCVFGVGVAIALVRTLRAVRAERRVAASDCGVNFEPEH